MERDALTSEDRRLGERVVAVGVADSREIEPQRRSSRARSGAVASVEDGSEFAGRAAPRSALQQRADDRPHHVVEETIGGNLDANEFAPRLEVEAPERPHRSFLRPGRGERTEIVFADQMGRGGAHGIEIERPVNVRGIAGQQRVRLRAIENRIHVPAFPGRKPRRKSGFGAGRLSDDEVRGKYAPQSRQQPVERKGSRRRERDHLAGCVNAAIGPPRARYFHRLTEELRQRTFQDARDRAYLGLPLKAAEIRPVVLDGKAKGRQRFARRSSAAAAA